MKLTPPSVFGLMTVMLVGALVAPSLADHTVSRERRPTVLFRGPVHEGFATPAVHTRHRGPVIAETPPEPLAEKPPGYSEKDNALTWLPGYWARDTQAKEFVWVSGCWRRAPPAQRWFAGYWHENDEGHTWIPGAWVVTIAGKTGSRTNQVNTTRGGLMEGIIRRVAWRRINALRSQADAITNRTTTADVATGFRNEAANHLARVNEKLDLPHLLPDMLTSATNGRQHVCSTDDAILICIGGHRPVVPTLPEVDSPADLQLWVHSSLLNSKLALALKGMEGLETIGPGLALLAPSELRSTKGILEVVVKRWLPIHRLDRQGEWMILQLNESVVSNTFAANPSP